MFIYSCIASFFSLSFKCYYKGTIIWRPFSGIKTPWLFKHHTSVEHSMFGTLTTSQYETENIEVKSGGQLDKKKVQERAKTWKWGLFLLGPSPAAHEAYDQRSCCNLHMAFGWKQKLYDSAAGRGRIDNLPRCFCSMQLGKTVLIFPNSVRLCCQVS